MPWDRIAIEWEEARSLLLHRFGLLSEDDLAAVRGERDRLLELLVAHYEKPRDHLDRQLAEFELRYVGLAA